MEVRQSVLNVLFKIRPKWRGSGSVTLQKLLLTDEEKIDDGANNCVEANRP
jgi:hypothetical protein